MWKPIEIEGKSFFINFQIVKNSVKFMLYDLKDSWYECLEMSQLIQRAKDLNKRIKYDDCTIENTVTTADAVEAGFVCSEGDSHKILKLKYRVNTLPFHFKWELKEQSDQEFREMVTFPLFLTVHGMQQQIEDLREVIRKKDIELKQYKNEGAVLRRTTVATQPFDMEQFDTKYSMLCKDVDGYQKLAKHILAQKESETDVKVSTDKPPKLEKEGVKESKAISIVSKNVKQKSPRHRKRKAVEMQQKQMVKKLNARKQTLQYESSQSQSMSESIPEEDENEQSQELAAIQRSLRLLERKRLEDLELRLKNKSS